MSKLSEIAALYRQSPVVAENTEIEVEGNSFTELVLQTKKSASAAFDRLAYLAGIKSAPADDKYRLLDTSSLGGLLSSARRAGYDVEVVGV
ncbi:hypothetical protein [Pseudomonas asplenii]|uniref:hypothetical protein n=1 Tax=Pseudomonas asplenii TaxID=53407 RepID=UPI00037B5118|nr:hypothetical protein [Pseudomonas fuscovaginae]